MVNKIVKFADHLTSFGGHAHPMFARLVRYSVSGCSSTGIDLLLLLISVEIFKVYYLYAAAFSFIFSASLNYLWSRRWGFKGTKTGHVEGYSYFISVVATALIITLLLLEFLVDVIHIQYILARIIIYAVVGIMSFFAHYFITFKLHLIKEN